MNDSVLEIPGYNVHVRLGKGGMAEVYLATQLSLNRKVAVKVLCNGEDEAYTRRFIKEGRIVAALRHPSIITIYDIDRLADGRHYLAMEFVPGGDLARHKGQVFEPRRALAITRQIAGGLAVVHDKGLVHRDIKPANILFRDDGTAVITDFGVAKEMEVDNEVTQFGIAIGSPAYSSPEQARCEPLDARSDIYSLGVILLEMLTGSNPFRSGGNYAQTVLNHVQMPVPRLPAQLADYQHLLDRMLAKDPDERFADCRALLASLDELREPDELDDTQLTPLPPPGKPRRRSRTPLLLWSLFAVLLVGAAVGGGYQIQQRMKIADLLERGEQRLAEGKLLEPVQDNADHFFRQVLALDKHNAQAQEGLRRVLQARIADYLQLAEQRFAEEALLLPEDDSAVFYYRRVLGWQPDNAVALTGLQRVAERYAQLSEAAYGRRQFPQALEYVRRGLEVQPDDPTLLALYADHDRRVRAARTVPAARASSRPASTAPSDSGQEKSNPVKRLWNRIFSN